MAQQGLLPKRLATCKVPLCTSCLFGKATRRPWHGKNQKLNSGPVRSVTKPGQCISIDQVISLTPSLIAQLQGKPMMKRYTSATVFVDQYSGFGYVHLQKTMNAEETVEAKKAFELVAESHGIKVQHYHADNGVFADNQFHQAVREKAQGLTFCGINTHFQNGRVEKRIRDLTDHARVMLIHTNHWWPKAITHHLWPYAFWHACTILNYTPSLQHKDGKSPAQVFSGSDVNINPKHWVPFGCPVYILDNALQNRKAYNKWLQHSRIGIYLRFSAQHARSVALVLNMQTRLTSPQFHMQFNTKFKTLQCTFGNDPHPESLWQQKCHFLPTSITEESAKKARHKTSRPSIKELYENPPARVPEGVPPDNNNDQGPPDDDDQGDDFPDDAPPPDIPPDPGPSPEPPPEPPAAPNTRMEMQH